MILGNRIDGTESTNDYLLCAQSDNFWLAVKPIISFEPFSATFSFGLRFRSVSDLPVTDPQCHGVVWGELPFKTLKPTHASVTCLTHLLHAKELKGKGNADGLMGLLDEKGLFDALASTVMQHFGEPEGLQHLAGEAITTGLREILGEKLVSVEDEMNTNLMTPDDIEVGDVDEEIANKVESFLSLVDLKKGGKGSGTLH
jgi:hypothetical protein